MFENSTVLVTGGTGSFGNAFVERLLTYSPRKILVLSRDEAKQEDMSRKFNDDRLRCILGDVRDYDRVLFAFRGVDFVAHAAALKRIPKGDTDPLEFTKTNVYGAENVVKAAIERDVKKVVTLSTDKAAAPCTHYGATKYLAETTTLAAATSYVGRSVATQFACTRYGNVANSRGSVIPLFRKLKAEKKPLTITDTNMSRFWMTLDDAVDLVFTAFQKMEGGELFIPKCPSFFIWDLALAIGGDMCQLGVRGSEKLHESLITEGEARDGVDTGDMYVLHGGKGVGLPRDFEYRSDKNEFLSVDELVEELKEIPDA